MSSSSARAFQATRGKLIHTSVPLVQVGNSMAVDPRKSKRLTRSGQRAAKVWVRQKTAELKALLKLTDTNPNIDRASFYYDEGKSAWMVGIFNAKAEAPHTIIQESYLADAVRKVNETTPEFISFFRKEDLNRAPPEDYPTLNFTVNA